MRENKITEFSHSKKIITNEDILWDTYISMKPEFMKISYEIVKYPLKKK